LGGQVCTVSRTVVVHPVAALLDVTDAGRGAADGGERGVPAEAEAAAP
jgi:hypothetical protein